MPLGGRIPQTRRAVVDPERFFEPPAILAIYHLTWEEDLMNGILPLVPRVTSFLTSYVGHGREEVSTIVASSDRQLQSQ